MNTPADTPAETPVRLTVRFFDADGDAIGGVELAAEGPGSHSVTTPEGYHVSVYLGERLLALPGEPGELDAPGDGVAKEAVVCKPGEAALLTDGGAEGENWRILPRAEGAAGAAGAGTVITTFLPGVRAGELPDDAARHIAEHVGRHACCVARPGTAFA